MNTKAIRQLADVTLDKYRSSIPPAKPSRSL